MTRLNQIIAVEKGVKAETYTHVTQLHQVVQKAPLLSGIARTYRPKDDEGDQLPPESTKVQINAESVLGEISGAMTRLFDITAAKDYTNCTAVGDVVVGGNILLSNVPATYLLFLEKQLADMHTFVKKLPVLDPSENWDFSQDAAAWATRPSQTVKTKKVLRNHEKAPATDRHPAQVDVYSEDVVVGYWQTIKFSGALPAARVNELVKRVEALQEAVKFAREAANMAEVVLPSVGRQVFQYLFGA